MVTAADEYPAIRKKKMGGGFVPAAALSLGFLESASVLRAC